MTLPRQMTMRELHERHGHRLPGYPTRSSLEDWHISVLDIPLEELSVGDLARACRQSFFVEITVPLAVEAIEKNPMEGDMYEGEMINALREITKDFWIEDPDLKDRLKKSCERAFSTNAYRDTTAEIRTAIRRVYDRLPCS